jgi:hypothetical protein
VKRANVLSLTAECATQQKTDDARWLLIVGAIGAQRTATQKKTTELRLEKVLCDHEGNMEAGCAAHGRLSVGRTQPAQTSSGALSLSSLGE